ncbi:heterokaryon incompatibility protein-domain-containing protein, partial [Alternaria alternata]
MDDISVITQRFDNLLHESTDQAESPSTSQDAQPLQYDRIPRGRSIRVLDLAPGTWDEPVNCSLRTVHLDDDDPRYEAISYAWGDHNDRKPVICNGYAITTTRSLFEALQRFRHVNTTRTLWADALCINQADGDEKTLQVRLMSYIYTKAVRVLVWLQHDDDRI